MDGQLLVAFAGVAALLIAVPGPDWAFVLAASTRSGAVLAPAVGLVIGYAVITVAVSLGLATIIAAVPQVMGAVTILGACYLAWIGYRTLRSSGEMTADSSDATEGRRFVWSGIGVSALNPKGLLIFIAILPQFTSADGRWPLAAQLATLGGVFMAICLGFYTILGASAHRVLKFRPRLSRWTNRVAGVAMIVVAMVLLVEQGLVFINDLIQL